jgi:hypothetical protein
VAVLMIGAVAIGYLVGRANAPSRAEAQAARLEAFSQAAKSTRAIAYRAAFSRAAASGRHDARVKARTRGASAGKKRARKVLARRARSASAPAVKRTTASADGPPYEHLGCGGDPYAAYGPNGCIPPAHPPTPAARPEDCPVGQIPVGVTGACAPRG